MKNVLYNFDDCKIGVYHITDSGMKNYIPKFVFFYLIYFVYVCILTLFNIYIQQMLAANHIKKGYYVRRVKDNLWGTFGINRIKPFDDNYTKQQMKDWKQQQNVKKVQEELYNPSDPDDPNSDTFLMLIIKSVFVAEEECTYINTVWTQVVLEVIFDENHLLSKIESDTVDSWLQKLTNIEEPEINSFFITVF